MEAAAAIAQVDTDDEEHDAPDVGEAHGRLQQRRQSRCSLVALLARGTPCLGVEAEYQPEYQDDQAEQRAKHDDSAHVCTPFDMHSIV